MKYLLAAALAACAVGCVPPPAHPRTQDAQRDAAMEVRHACVDVDPFVARAFVVRANYGSAVVVSETSAYTAAHVVNCGFQGHVTLVAVDGTEYPATVDLIDAEHDVARLVGRFPAVRPVLVGPVLPSQTVCQVPGFPGREPECGGVTGPGVPGGNLETDFVVVHGNSGAGVYQSGRLVGIVTQVLLCDDLWCGSRFRTLTGTALGI